uniref:B-cell receptor CD22 n=1 Tax=Mastacembelus armatus TaxID=205130 RepID=A0A7N8YFA2_9TELE
MVIFHMGKDWGVADGWRVTYTATDICAIKGSTVNISCTYTYPSNVRVQETFWFTKGTNTDPVDLRTQSEYSGRVQYQCKYKTCILTIRDLRETDSAQYKFRFITNQPGGDFTGSPGVTLTVTDGPRLLSVSVSPSAEIVEGSSVTLTCSSDANPAANYTWYKKHGNPSLQPASKQFNFSSIQSSDSGEYYCTAENDLGRRTSGSIFIHVTYGPKLLSVSVSPSAEIVEGSSVTLTCSSDANPAANYTWYKENEESPKASGQTFTITDIRPEHSGKYYCESQNTRGRHNTTSQLTVVCLFFKPGKFIYQTVLTGKSSLLGGFGSAELGGVLTFDSVIVAGVRIKEFKTGWSQTVTLLLCPASLCRPLVPQPFVILWMLLLPLGTLFTLYSPGLCLPCTVLDSVYPVQSWTLFTLYSPGLCLPCTVLRPILHTCLN